MTAAYLEDEVIELRKGSSRGSQVPFTAEISSSGRVVSITPDSQLSSGTKYYVIVNRGTLTNSRGDQSQGLLQLHHREGHLSHPRHFAHKRQDRRLVQLPNQADLQRGGV